jgi:hypothetical protein
MDTYLTPTNLFVVFVATTAILSITVEWRISLVILLIQYLAAATLLGRFVTPQVAAIKVFVGALVCVILYLAARSAEHHPDSEGFVTDAERRSLVWNASVSDLLLRALAVAVVGTGVLGTNLGQTGFESGQATLAPAAWLVVIGLLLLVLGRATFAVGLGLLTFLTGFEVFYSPIDSSPLMLGALAAVHVLLALGVAYGLGQEAEEV